MRIAWVGAGAAPETERPVPVVGSPLTELVASARRGTWVVLDQALSSFTNFALSLLVLRFSSPRQFGAFSVALMAYTFALMTFRALGGEPQVVRLSDVPRAEWRQATQATTGLALVLGAVGSVVLLMVAFLIGGPVAAALVPLAATLPGLLLQDAWRFAFFAAGTPRAAFKNDLVWMLAQVAFVGWAAGAGGHDVAVFVLAWGTAATLSGLVGLGQAGIAPNPVEAWSWLSEHKDLGPRFLAEFLVDSGSSQLMLIVVGAISGLDALGALNGARVLLGPVNLVYLGALGFAVPEGVRLARQSPHRLYVAVKGLASFLPLLALTCAGVVFLLPAGVGRLVVGEMWPRVQPILLYTALWVAASGVSLAARVGLRVRADSRRSLAARASLAPLILAGGTTGAILGDAVGAAAGLAVAHSVGAVIHWRQFVRSSCEVVAGHATQGATSRYRASEG